ncbi:hypothetical protein Tco_0787830 [Tanacetum coccineum]
MREGMFLGYKVNADGLKVCPDKADAVLNLPSPRCLKDMQKLNEKLASLKRFLSKSAEKSLPFFKILKKCTKKMYSTSQSDTVDLLIKDRECEWSMMDELAIRPGQYFALTLVRRGKFSLMVLNTAGEALTACENYASYVAYKKALSIGINCADMLQWLFGFILGKTPVWRMESYALKFVDDVLLGIFMNVPMVILVFRVNMFVDSRYVLDSGMRVSGQHFRSFHASAWIQDSGAPGYAYQTTC